MIETRERVHSSCSYAAKDPIAMAAGFDPTPPLAVPSRFWSAVNNNRPSFSTQVAQWGTRWDARRGAQWGTRGRRKVARTCTAPRLRSLVSQTKDILVDYISKVNFTTRNQRPVQQPPSATRPATTLCEGRYLL